MPALITTDLVALDADLGADKGAVVRRLAELVAAAGRATGADALHADALAREAQAPTGLPGGIAIPHCRSAAVTEASLAFARLSPKVDFGAPDGPADLAFLIAAPAHGDADHLTLLTALARALVRPEFVASLRAAASDEEIVAAGRRGRLARARAAPAARRGRARRCRRRRRAAAAAPPRKSVVVVSACPTGIAHTYMAADKLAAAGKAAGVDIHVETQGSSGSTPLDPAVIRAADAVDLRRRRRRAGPGPVRRQAARAERHQAGHQRARRDDPRGARRRGRPERPPRGRHRRRRTPAAASGGGGRAPARRSAAGCSPASAT